MACNMMACNCTGNCRRYGSCFGGPHPDHLPGRYYGLDTLAPRGCICPPGSEATCQGFGCPRKNPFAQYQGAESGTGQAPT